MTTTKPTPDVPLPSGADPDLSGEILPGHSPIKGWEPDQDGHPAYRIVWSQPLFDEDLFIRACVYQYADGTIATECDDAPLVSIGDEDFRPDIARRGIRNLALAIDPAAPFRDFDPRSPTRRCRRLPSTARMPRDRHCTSAGPATTSTLTSTSTYK